MPLPQQDLLELMKVQTQNAMRTGPGFILYLVCDENPTDVSTVLSTLEKKNIGLTSFFLVERTAHEESPKSMCSLSPTEQ